MKNKSLFDNVQWLGGFFVMMTAGLSITVFLFTSFESKSDAKDYRSAIEKRLERIEVKLDAIIAGAHK